MSDHSRDETGVLRKRAEKRLKQVRLDPKQMDGKELAALVHDLQVHQVELEMQNEDLRTTQRQLERARDRYSRLFDNAPVGYLIIDDAGIIHQANSTFARLLGLSPDQLHRKPVVSYIDKRDAPVFLARFKAFFVSPSGKSMVVRITNGSAQFYAKLEGRVESSPVLDDDGAKDPKPFLLLIVSDISELMETDRALVKSESKLKTTLERLRFHVDNSPLAVIVWDSDNRITSWSPQAERIFGWPESAALGKSWNDLGMVYAEDLEGVEQVVGNLFSGKNTFNVTLNRNVRKDGEVIHCQWFNSALRNSDGEIISILSQVEDVTLRIQAAQALERSEKRFRKILEQIPQIGLSMDAEGTILFANRYVLKLTGFDEDAVLGANMFELLVPEEERSRQRDDFARRIGGMKDGDYYVEDKDLLTATGELRHVFWAGVLSRDLSGAVQDVTYMGVDMTDHRRVHDQMVMARDAADAANLAKSEFLANMSHEIRTPLNGILGMLQLMESTALSNEQSEYTAVAIKSCNRLTRLLNDILDLSRVEAGKLEIHENTFSILDLLQSVQDIFHKSVLQKKIELNVSLDDSVPEYLIGDDSRVRQVLFNLVGNAVKFTQEGGVEVAVQRLQSSTPDQCRLLFTISDTGPGIPDAMQDHVFEAFAQVENSATRQFGGAGLGLAIVKRLLSLLNGHGSIVSTEGSGTTIHLTIPFRLPVGTPLGLAGEDIQPKTLLEKKHILLAEDEETNRMTIVRGLEKKGLVVSCATNGQEALDMLREHDYDAILMDIRMPVMDGLEATNAIRHDPSFNDKSAIPIIALTAFAMQGDREKFLDAGMDGYISKPVKIEALMELLATRLGQ